MDGTREMHWPQCAQWHVYVCGNHGSRWDTGIVLRTGSKWRYGKWDTKHFSSSQKYIKWIYNSTFIGIYTVNYEKKRKDNKIQNDKKSPWLWAFLLLLQNCLKNMQNNVDKWGTGWYTQIRCWGSAETTQQLERNLKRFQKKLLTKSDRYVNINICHGKQGFPRRKKISKKLLTKRKRLW